MTRYRTFMRACEREFWAQVMAESGHSISRAARLAGVHRSWAHHRIHGYGLAPSRPAASKPITDPLVTEALRKFLR